MSPKVSGIDNENVRLLEVTRSLIVVFVPGRIPKACNSNPRDGMRRVRSNQGLKDMGGTGTQHPQLRDPSSWGGREALQESGLWMKGDALLAFLAQFSRLRLSVYSALRLSDVPSVCSPLLSSSNHVKTPAASFFVTALPLGYRHSADLALKEALVQARTWITFPFASSPRQRSFFVSEFVVPDPRGVKSSCLNLRYLAFYIRGKSQVHGWCPFLQICSHGLDNFGCLCPVPGL